MQVGTFFENAAKCEDTKKVCNFEELKGDLPVNTTTNMTFGFKGVTAQGANIEIPKNYFCFAKVLNHDQNDYYGVKIQKNKPSKTDKSSELVFLREKVITEKDDPMPAKDMYWND